MAGKVLGGGTIELLLLAGRVPDRKRVVEPPDAIAKLAGQDDKALHCLLQGIGGRKRVEPQQPEEPLPGRTNQHRQMRVDLEGNSKQSPPVRGPSGVVSRKAVSRASFGEGAVSSVEVAGGGGGEDAGLYRSTMRGAQPALPHPDQACRSPAPVAAEQSPPPTSRPRRARPPAARRPGPPLPAAAGCQGRWGPGRGWGCRCQPSALTPCSRCAFLREPVAFHPRFHPRLVPATTVACPATGLGKTRRGRCRQQKYRAVLLDTVRLRDMCFIAQTRGVDAVSAPPKSGGRRSQPVAVRLEARQDAGEVEQQRGDQATALPDQRFQFRAHLAPR
jgi:hypothetical protein